MVTVADVSEENPIVTALAELSRRIEAGEDLGSVEIDFDALEPREPDPEWDEWERAALIRAFED